MNARRSVWPKRVFDRIGMVVESTRPLANSLVMVPEGTRFKVTGWMRGMQLEQVDACPCCGVRSRFGRVGTDSVRPVLDNTPISVDAEAVAVAPGGEA